MTHTIKTQHVAAAIHTAADQVRGDALDRDIGPRLLRLAFAHAVDDKGAGIFQLQVVPTCGISGPEDFTNEIGQDEVGPGRVEKKQLRKFGRRKLGNQALKMG